MEISTKELVGYSVIAAVTIAVIWFNFIYLPAKDIVLECNSVSSQPEDSGLADKYTSLVGRYNLLVNEYKEAMDEYDNLYNTSREIYEENQFWRQEDYRKSQQMELCKNENTDVPDKPLSKREVCAEGCPYKLICSDSMKPFFDCTDTLTIYENVEEDEIQLCDIIGFKTPEYPGFDWVAHRVISINESGYQTKGDARTYPDNYTVQFDDIIFKVIGVEYN